MLYNEEDADLDPMDAFRKKLGVGSASALVGALPAGAETAEPYDQASALKDVIREGEDRKRQQAAAQAAVKLNAAPAGPEAGILADQLKVQGKPVPVDVVAADTPRFQAEAEAAKALADLTNAPLTARWLADEENAKYARRDVAYMAKLESMFRKPTVADSAAAPFLAFGQTAISTVGSGIKGAATAQAAAKRTEVANGVTYTLDGLTEDTPQNRTMAAGRLRALSAIADDPEFMAIADMVDGDTDMKTITAALKARVEAVTPQAEPLFTVGEWVGSRLQETLAPAPGTEDNLITQLGAGIGSTVAFAGAAVLTRGSSLLGTTAFAAGTGIDEAYERARAAGQTQEQAMKYGLGGSIPGAIQAISIEVLLRRLPIPAKRRFGAVVKDLAVTAGAEAVVEALGAVGQNAIAMQYDPKTGLFDDTLLAGGLAGTSAGLLRGLMLALAPGARAHLFHDITRGEQSGEMEKTFKALSEGVAQSDMREKVPERFRSWATAMTDGTPMETVFVSPEGLLSLSQTAKDPALLKQIVEVLPGVTMESFEAAIAGGSDLAIPMSTWMTEVIGTKVDNLLIDHVRFNSTQMTTFERKANAVNVEAEIASLRDRIKSIADGGTAEDLSTEEQARVKVFDEARGAMVQSGVEPRAAESYAAQYSVWFARQASRVNMTIEEFTQRFPLVDINIDGTNVRMAPRQTEVSTPKTRVPFRDTLVEARNPATTNETAIAARAQLIELGLDIDTMTDGEVVEALTMGDGLNQMAVSAAPGSAALGRGIDPAVAREIAESDTTGVVNGIGPSARAFPSVAEGTITKDGKPLVLYHGTNAEFDQFRDGPTFLVSRRGLATEHALRGGAKGARVIQATAALQNPLRMDAKDDDTDTFWLRNSLKAETAQIEGNHDGIVITNDRGETLVITTRGDQITQVTPPTQSFSQDAVDQLPGLEKASPGRVPGVRELASDYMREAGLPVRHQATYAAVDVSRAKQIAALYDAAPDAPNDPEVRAAYDALAAETIAQYEALTRLGYTFEWIKGADPYTSPADAIRDMQKNKHLWVFPTTDGFGSGEAASTDNPLLQPTTYEIDGRTALVNDLFRIVHDVFGHGSEGAAFGARGEENAWQAHVRMFSPLAARAMTSETRGQNSWVNFGPKGEANRADPKNTTFADQKSILLPEWVSMVGQTDDWRSTQVEVDIDDGTTQQMDAGTVVDALDARIAAAEAFLRCVNG